VKFIVDAQLPRTLSLWLVSKGFDSVHTLDLSNGNTSLDKEILELSTKENRVVVSKDSDFLESLIIRSIPQKLLLVKTGNIRNSELLRIFSENINTVHRMLKRSRMVEIRTDEIIEHDF